MMRGRGSKSGQTQENEGEMALDTDKIDDAALAILSLTLHYGD